MYNKLIDSGGGVFSGLKPRESYAGVHRPKGRCLKGECSRDGQHFHLSFLSTSTAFLHNHAFDNEERCLKGDCSCDGQHLRSSFLSTSTAFLRIMLLVMKGDV